MNTAQQLKALGILLGAGLLLIGALLFVFFPKPGNMVGIAFKGATIRATLADTEEERTKGLSGTKSLAADKGMLFVFPNDGYWGIWMKDMHYAIDIIWLNEQKSVVHIQEFVTPESYPHTFVTPVPCRYVLEVQSGLVNRHKLRVGDTLKFTIDR